MEKNIKIFAILALMCMAYALPIDEQQQQEPVESVNEPQQLDLLVAESSPITDSDLTADEIVREKRHGGYGNLK